MQEPNLSKQPPRLRLLRSASRVRNPKTVAFHGLTTYLLEPIGDHVPNSPALVFYQVAQGCEQNAVACLLFLGHDLGDSNEDLHSEEAHAILVVLGEVLEQGYHFLDDNSGGHLLDKLGEMCSGLATDHGGLIVDQEAELLSELLLDSGGDFRVWCSVETAS